MFAWTMLSALAVAALFAMALELRRLHRKRAFSGGRRPTVRLDGPEELQPRIAPAVFTWQGE